MKERKRYEVALAGNPNVGKSTVFNALTGMKQHTGNWPGKTVERAEGVFTSGETEIKLVDVRGKYSLSTRSPDESVAVDYVRGENGVAPPDAVIVVCDACILERSLDFALQIIGTGRKTLLCVNLVDEAEKKGISIDFGELEKTLGVPVVPCAARSGVGLSRLKQRLEALLASDGVPLHEALSSSSFGAAHLVAACVKADGDVHARDRRLDALLAGKYTALPTAALLLALVFFITLRGASPISDVLSRLLTVALEAVRGMLSTAGVWPAAVSLVCDGVLKVLFWVVSVMFPPMAIFFPLFTLIEDFGYLPRVAYNFDRCFACCGACGKQALTMMMGVGCNAAGVTGCRIIDSPRERRIAILTNSFMPCNGRFPVIAAFISIAAELAGVGDMPFFTTLFMCLAVGLGTALTMAVSKVLSVKVLQEETSSFTLELPPYRIPKFSDVIIRSVFDRTLFVLGRAIAVAAPAGVVVWLLGNVKAGGVGLFSHAAAFLDPVARPAGLDGVMLCAFILALPAAEIIVPLMLLGYSGGTVLGEIGSISLAAETFASEGWTAVTAACATVFTLVHWPCSTTILTVYKETRSFRDTALSVLLPTVIGYVLCVALNFIFS